MTKQTKNTGRQTGMLKAVLLTGGVIATLAGTRLIALQEPAAAGELSASAFESVTVVVPQESESSVPLPPTLGGGGTQLQLEPIPQVVQPQIRPVARTRSSR